MRFDLDIIYEDNKIIVVDKPFDILTISDGREKENTLYHRVSQYVKSKYKNNKIFIVHRLDYATSGLIVFAKDFSTKIELQKLFEEGKIIRKYQAVLSSKLDEEEGTIIQYLKEDKFHNVIVSKKSDKYSKEAITKYKVVKYLDNKFPCLDIQILTGRRNQIRIAFSSKGSPILGDEKYNGLKRKRMYLHAYNLDLRAYRDVNVFNTFSTKCLF